MKSTDKMGVIYILTNPSFPEYVKIGYAKDIEKRLAQLNRSECMPFAFRVYATYETAEPLQDKKLHAMIDQINPDLRSIETFDGRTRTKEFYAMSKEEAYNILKAIAELSGTLERLKLLTPEGHEIADQDIAAEVQEEAKERRTPFTFFACGIQAGEVLTFRDHPEITATVKNDRQIEYNGQITSLSASAREILQVSYNVAGTIYWTYHGCPLCDIRSQIENTREESDAKV